MLIGLLCLYYVFGLALTLWMVQSLSRGIITLGDVVIAPAVAIAWPVAFIMFVSIKGEDIVIWRRNADRR